MWHIKYNSDFCRLLFAVVKGQIMVYTFCSSQIHNGTDLQHCHLWELNPLFSRTECLAQKA